MNLGRMSKPETNPGAAEPIRDCPFCRIAAGAAPAQIVFQDEEIVAFRDIHPQAPTHILLIPRRHIDSLGVANSEDAVVLGRLMLAAAQIARQERPADGFRVVINTGAGAGQSVFHLHLHLLGGRRMAWPPG
jgi:histidine triad (HIT) family protein